MLAVEKNRYLSEASEGLWKGRPAMSCVHKTSGTKLSAGTFEQAGDTAHSSYSIIKPAATMSPPQYFH